jgi:hypothetical protein
MIGVPEWEKMAESGHMEIKVVKIVDMILVPLTIWLKTKDVVTVVAQITEEVPSAKGKILREMLSNAV